MFLDFICAYHHCDFLRGLHILKSYAGIVDNGEESTPSRLLATSVAKRFKSKVKKEKKSKGIILPKDYMNRYEWNVKKFAVWEREGISMESMERFQVRYDPFSDRLVYPIKDIDGNIISVCGERSTRTIKRRRLESTHISKVLDTSVRFMVCMTI